MPHTADSEPGPPKAGETVQLGHEAPIITWRIEQRQTLQLIHLEAFSVYRCPRYNEEGQDISVAQPTWNEWQTKLPHSIRDTYEFCPACLEKTK